MPRSIPASALSNGPPEIRADEVRKLLRQLVPWAALAVGLFIAWMIWVTLLFREVGLRDAMDSAQAARHLAHGDGFITSVIRPLGFSFVQDLQEHPDLINAPFMTVLMAVLFNIGGDGDRMVALASGLGWIMCGLLIFGLTLDLTRKKGLAYLAAAFWAVNVAGGSFGVSGDNVTWSAALLTATLWLCLRGERRADDARREHWNKPRTLAEMPYRWAVASGVTAGLLTLCEPALTPAVWIPLIIFWVRWPHRAQVAPFYIPPKTSIKYGNEQGSRTGYSVRLAAVLFSPLLIVVLPWYLRSLLITWPDLPGVLRSYSALAYSDAYPGDSVFRYVKPPGETAATFWILHFLPALRDTLGALPRLPATLFQFAGLAPMLIFVVGLFQNLERALRAVRGAMIGMFALAVIFFSLWSVDAKNFLVFAPMVTAVAVTGLSQLIWARYTPPRRRMLVLDDDEKRHVFFDKKYYYNDIKHVWTADEAIEALERETFDIAYLDHDLGGTMHEPSWGSTRTGYEVAKWLAEHPDHRPAQVFIHSQNPAGTEKMLAVLPDAEVETTRMKGPRGFMATVQSIHQNTRRKQMYALAMLLVALPLIEVRMNKQRMPRQRPQIPPGLTYIINNGEADDVVLTDAPWLVAWYGQRRAVWLPQRTVDLELMRELGAEFDWVYIANVQPRDRREVGDWWGDLVTDPEGWDEFRTVEPRFRLERVMKREL
jgi:CheY-like chemotaxis protein